MAINIIDNKSFRAMKATTLTKLTRAIFAWCHRNPGGELCLKLTCSNSNTFWIVTLYSDDKGKWYRNSQRNFENVTIDLSHDSGHLVRWTAEEKGQ
jgi:hypothetical protein